MKKQIAIIYGGPGNEHDVSVASAETVFAALNKDNYVVTKIFMSKDGVCVVNEKEMNLVETLNMLPKDSIIIPVFHGAYGEGGEVQKILEDLEYTYLWSTSSASLLAMDKYKAAEVLESHGLSTPKTILIEQIDQRFDISFPCILKPKDEGSSVDLYKVGTKDELQELLDKSLKKHATMLVQEYVSGREFACGVFEIKQKSIPLVPTEIILTKGEVFDYEAKYTAHGCLEVTPAEASGETIQKIQDIAVKAHLALGCRDISRTDMIMKEDGTIIVLEVNTIPGMTPTSFIPAQAKASGYTLSEILDIVIHNHL